MIIFKNDLLSLPQQVQKNKEDIESQVSDVAIATQKADEAIVLAESVENLAQTANNNSTQALATANSANATATTALNNVTQAQAEATQAITTSNNAIATANNAFTIAQDSEDIATQANTTANSASTLATQANTTANNAFTIAQDSEDIATQANTTANNALPKTGGTITGRLTCNQDIHCMGDFYMTDGDGVARLNSMYATGSANFQGYTTFSNQTTFNTIASFPQDARFSNLASFKDIRAYNDTSSIATTTRPFSEAYIANMYGRVGTEDVPVKLAKREIIESTTNPFVFIDAVFGYEFTKPSVDNKIYNYSLSGLTLNDSNRLTFNVKNTQNSTYRFKFDGNSTTQTIDFEIDIFSNVPVIYNMYHNSDILWFTSTYTITNINDHFIAIGSPSDMGFDYIIGNLGVLQIDVKDSIIIVSYVADL